VLIEILLFGGSAALLNQRMRKKRALAAPDTANSNTNTNANGDGKAKRRFSGLRFVRDINQALRAEGRQQLQLDIDPKVKEQAEENRRRTNQRLVLASGATGMALLGTVYPIFTLAGAVGVLYLSRDWFALAWRDLKRGHLLSLSLLGFVMTIGTIAVGQLFLAALGAVLGNLFAKMVHRLETSSQEQLVRVFGGHPEKVWLLRDGTEIQIEFHAIRPGDTIVVNAGEVIPVDGAITAGDGQVDQHLLTGESQPIEKAVGDQVFASTLLLSGRLVVGVETAGDATVAAKIGKILNGTQSYKDTLMNRGREIADNFLPVTAALSLGSLVVLGPRAAIAVLWSSLGGLMGLLGPLSVLSYLQILSRHKNLIKDGRVFESLRSVDTIVFDKTGTLTKEQPKVYAVHAFDCWSDRDVLRYAAGAEYRQPHPIAKAIVDRARDEHLDVPEPAEAGYEVGYGIRVNLEQRAVRVGSARYLQRANIEFPEGIESIRKKAEEQSHSLIYVAIDGRVAGVLEMEPTVRPEAANAVAAMKQRNVELCIISGDHEGPTRQMAKKLGIERYFAEVLPEDKGKLVKKLRDEGRFVCYIGDGINDAIALKAAQVGISLKGASSAATDTAQIIFMDGTLSLLEPLFQLADEFERTMQRNLAISVVPGLIVIGGVYFFHFGIAAGMVIFYSSCTLGLTNVLLPLARHQGTELAALEHGEATWGRDEGESPGQGGQDFGRKAKDLGESAAGERGQGHNPR